MKEAVIVSITRTAVGRAKKGSFAQTRAEDLGKAVLEEAVRRVPGLDKGDVEDIIIGCAMPEGEQGLNFARTMSLYAGFPVTVPAITVNRFCSSGLQAIAYAAERIMLGHAEVVIAGGVESMSHVPMTGFKLSPHPRLVETMPEVYMGMGHTAEAVASRFGISREAQDGFATRSHQKAAAAIAAGRFTDEIVPVSTSVKGVDERGKAYVREYVFATDEGVRPDTSVEGLSKLKPAFSLGGCDGGQRVTDVGRRSGGRADEPRARGSARAEADGDVSVLCAFRCGAGNYGGWPRQSDSESAEDGWYFPRSSRPL
jgi:acetyl-CoA acyltransferase